MPVLACVVMGLVMCAVWVRRRRLRVPRVRRNSLPSMLTEALSASMVKVPYP